MVLLAKEVDVRPDEAVVASAAQCQARANNASMDLLLDRRTGREASKQMLLYTEMHYAFVHICLYIHANVCIIYMPS